MSALEHPSFVDSSLEELLRSVQPRLKPLFARFSIPLQDTEDLLQQALLALVYQRPTVRDPEAWLVGTLRNKCLVYLRDRRRRLYEAVDAAVLELMAEPTAPDQETADRRRDLSVALEQLPDRCRSLLSLRYQGYAPPELAARLGYSQASLGKITRRCLAALTSHLIHGGAIRKKGET
jgi:RNA polymerase sigma factor (sigma-70 family)